MQLMQAMYSWQLLYHYLCNFVFERFSPRVFTTMFSLSPFCNDNPWESCPPPAIVYLLLFPTEHQPKSRARSVLGRLCHRCTPHITVGAPVNPSPADRVTRCSSSPRAKALSQLEDLTTIACAIGFFPVTSQKPPPASPPFHR